jgi:LCP family protein required for cell wall assembly
VADSDHLNDAAHPESSIDAAPPAVSGGRPAAGWSLSDIDPTPPPRQRWAWWTYVAVGIPMVVLVAGGLALGLYVYIVTHTLVQDANASRRPFAQAFGFPLTLKERVNVLLIGTDVTLNERRQITNVSRADTLILTSFDPEQRRLVAMSIPRDTRAEIPGFGTTKVNASYAYGGHNLSIRTVEHLTGVKVHFFVKLGPESFTHIIDALGGIDVDVEKDMKYTDSWAGYTIDLKKGRQRLTGGQATGYIRFRHDALGDIARVERQRKVMQALMRELRQPSVVMATPRLLQAFAQNTQTNLTATELMTIGAFVARDAALTEATLPGTFGETYWEPDTPKVRRLVAELFYNIDPDALAAIRVEVLNGSGLPGLGYVTASRLQGYGFKSVRVRAAAPADVTRVIDRSGRPNVGRMVASTMRRAVLARDQGGPRLREREGADVTVILGQDLRPQRQSTMVKPVSPP